MNTIETNKETVENKEFDCDKNRTIRWLCMMDNQEAVRQIEQEPGNLKFQELVQQINADPIFRALDEIIGRDRHLDPGIGHESLEIQFFAKYTNFAKTIYGAQGWVKALKTFRIEGTPAEIEGRRWRQNFLKEPFAVAALAAAVNVPIKAVNPKELAKRTPDEQNYIWVLHALENNRGAVWFAWNPEDFQDEEAKQLFLEVTAEAYLWEQLRQKWTVQALGIDTFWYPLGQYHTIEEIADAWKIGQLQILDRDRLQAIGKDIKQDVWKLTVTGKDNGFGYTEIAPWINKLKAHEN